jgi:hypothetical protein
VFAGAAREAVFSQPENVRRINAEFVPVALKAGLVYNPFFQNIPPTGEEGRLYRELARSMPAPQGIGVVNSAGKALDWAMAFDNDRSVLAFLDHARKRFARFPDARQRVSTERYARFPSQKGADAEDSGEAPQISERHPAGESCPAKPPLPLGTVDARLFGRALDSDGKPVADAVPQENYVEDRFDIPVSMQESLTRALAGAGTARFRIEDDLARLLAGHAYLGQLDLNPAQGNPIECEFWGRKVEAGAEAPARIRIEGTSKAAAASSREDQRARIDGAFWEHEVRLAWEGLIEVREARVTRLLLLGRGTEKLKWDNKHLPLAGKADVTSLTAGHAINLAGAVRYGIVGTPVPAGEAAAASTANAAAGAANQVSEQDRKQLTQALGSTFLVFRDRVQADLKLSEEQKRSAGQQLSGIVQDARRFFESLNTRRPEERQEALGSYQRKAQERLTLFLRGALKADQIRRLRQVELQQDGLFALGRPDVSQELRLTGEQRQRFMGVIQEMAMTIEPLVRQLQASGNPQEIGPKVMQVRKNQESKLEALLSDAQKKQWKEMLGRPLDLGG